MTSEELSSTSEELSSTSEDQPSTGAGRVRRPRPPRRRRSRVTLLPQLLAAAVESGPATEAVRCEGESWTYAELDEASSQLARLLIERGLGPEDLVAMAVPRSRESVLATWAIVKSGAAVVPVDPTYPQGRIEHMLTDSGVSHGFTVSEVRDILPDEVEWIVLDAPSTATVAQAHSGEPVTYADRTRPLRPEHPAYVIYTSGSTGLPKGVVVTHTGLEGFCAEQVRRYRLTATSRTLHFASPSFDASMLELLLAVGAGSTMIVVPPTVYGGAELAELIAAEQVTHAFVTPAALASVDPTGLDRFGTVVVGGEACPAELVARWAPADSERRFHNGYGPTETTIMTNISDPLGAGQLVTIGRPIGGMSAYVLDDHLQPVPAGVAGELYLSGPQLARGYHLRPSLTSERFVANPHGEPGERMYRTGDVVRWVTDSEGGLDIEYVGRSDFQVKIHGFRIELGEIDAVVGAHEAVDFVATLGRRLPSGDTALVTYVRPAAGASIDAAEILELARRSLPRHMIPAAVVSIDTIPLAPTGKLDRNALPEPVFAVKEYREPRTDTERLVARVFAEVLGVDRVGADDDFFELGGNSLVATQVAARLGAALDRRVQVRSLFENSTVARMAAALDGSAAAPRVRLQRRVPRPERMPLSPAQQRMWFLNRFDPDSAINNIPIVIRLEGKLDTAALAASITDLVARHEVLRTVYPEQDGTGTQVVLPAGRLRPNPAAEPVGESELVARLADLAATGFDVTCEVPVRVGLFEIGPEDHVLGFVVHHIAADGSSIAPLVRDVTQAYLARVAGTAPGWSELSVQYADYALWQREMLGDETDPDSVAAEEIAYWRAQLDDAQEVIRVPSDRPRPQVASHRGATHSFVVDADLHRRLDELARARGMSLFMVVHAALAIVLSRLSATRDVVVGTPIAGRGDVALDDLIGMFVNTLVLRTEIDPALRADELLERVRDTDLEAFAHADIPFERLVETLSPVRSQAHHPLFQVALFFQNMAREELALPGLTVTSLDPGSVVAKFDLEIGVTPVLDADGSPRGLAVSTIYATDLFDEQTVEVFGERLTRVLSQLADEPAALVGAIDVLAPAERDLFLHGSGGAAHEVDPGHTLASLFAEQAARTPDATAIVHGDLSLTYAEFSARVNRLARFLIERGVGPESLVALGVRRSVDLVVGMYAVVAAGGAYVPLDPDHPAERIGHILTTARPVCVLTTGADAFTTEHAPTVAIDRLDLSRFSPESVSDADRAIGPLRSSDPAYVIFTSGSTGRPKGVAVEHRAIVNQVLWMQHEYAVGPADVYLQKTATTFDVSLWGFFVTLLSGATLVVASPDGHRDPDYLARTIEREQVTLTDFVPSMLSAFVAAVDGAALASLREVFVIGEALPVATAAAFAALSESGLHNLYGPTEAAVSITYHRVDGSETTGVPIGLPQWNSGFRVLDGSLRPVPAGVPGELYLTGVQLARGYVARPDLTADRFVADPYAGDGARMYRTGDLAALRADGALDYLGRTDFQVKFRGQRIELGEIESALVSDASVMQSVSLVVPTAMGDQLVGYVVPVPGAEIDVPHLKETAARRLPAYMVPGAIVVLDELPLNASGKLDRRALPAPTFEVRRFRAPSTHFEEVVASTLAAVLGLDRVGSDDDFFELGGNSLNATQFVARLGRALDTTVPVRTVFETSTVSQLAAHLETHLGEGTSPVLAPRPRTGPVPLSFAQQRMWFLNRFEPGSAVDNLPVAIRLSGELDVPALTRAIHDVVARHEVLRTFYPEYDGQGVQQILSVAEAADSLELVVESIGQGETTDAVARFASAGFDVTERIPVRVCLFRVSVTEHVLVFVVHHIAADAFSMGPLSRDVMVAYMARTLGEAPAWAPLTVQYADFALWQREVLGSEHDADSVLARQLRFWSDELEGLPERLDLPADRVRPAVASRQGGTHGFLVEADVHSALNSLAREGNASLFMVVHAALAVLLARVSGTGDIVIGTPVAGRGEAALDDLVGMFVNTLVLRTTVDTGSTFSELLAKVRATDLDAFGHADVPFERLVEELDPPRSQAHHPLFQVALTFQNTGPAGLDLPGLTVGGVDLDVAAAKFDLQLTVVETFGEFGEEAGLSLEFVYATDLFDASTIEVMAERFRRILSGVSTGAGVVVGDLELMSTAESARVVDEWNSSGPAIPVTGTLADLFDAAVTAHPGRTAVRFGDVTLTYTELDARVNVLARRLIAEGVGPESLVAVALPRSADLVVALLAVIKAGGGYLPIDPEYPAERIEYILSDGRPVCLITTVRPLITAPVSVPIVAVDDETDCVDNAPIDDSERVRPLSAANTAYVIYTSGSTGRPKGVLVPHRNVLALFADTRGLFGFDETDVWTMFHSFAFDFSVWELWGPLIHGGTLVVVDYLTSRSPEQFLELLAREQVTVLNQTPSAFYQFAAAEAAAAPDRQPRALRYVVFGGEALEPARLADWYRRHGDASPSLINMYGITETTVHVSFRELSAADVESGSGSVIGRAIPGLTVYVLDARMRPVPPGVSGEMYVGGVQGARGYRDRPDLTAVRFVANPFAADGSTLYRTGDVARWTAGGDLDYLGRADEQVKVRGFRIELGEIAAVLLSAKGVADVAVVVRDDVAGKRIVAYVVPVLGPAPSSDELRTAAAERLPDYMVPSAFVLLDEIPLTSNGKLNRSALPAPTAPTRAFRAPATPLEEIVAQTFSDLLGVDGVGLDDDFFELGGNSLIATRAAARLGSALGTKIPIRTLFEAGTVADLAARVESNSGTDATVPLTRRERPARIPLSFAQRRMWFLNRFDPGSAVDNIPFVIRLSGDLDVPALSAALVDVVDRHESLRTVYPVRDGEGWQVVLGSPESGIALETRSVDRGDLAAAVGETVGAGFDVTAEVPVRAVLFCVAPAEYVLVVVIHHIAADGFSLAPLARDVMTAYQARRTCLAPQWAELPVQYADYTLWQREVLGSEDDPASVNARQEKYWAETLAGIPEQIELPADRPRPAVASHRGASVVFSVSDRTHRDLLRSARDQGASLFMVVHGALAVLLSRLSGELDVVIGTPVAGRGEAGLDDMVGMFVNTLALRTHVDPGQSFAEFLGTTVREVDLGAFGHSDVPFERLVEILDPVRSGSRHPLFQVALAFQNTGRGTFELDDLSVEPVDVDVTVAKFDLQLTVVEKVDDAGAPNGIVLEFTYATDLFDESTVASYADRLVRIFDGVVSDSTVTTGDLEILDHDERVRLTSFGGGAAVDVGTVADLLAATSARWPDRTAVRDRGRSWTYGEFDERSSRLARALVAREVGPESLVAVSVPRSIDSIVAVAAVLKAGAAFVPVDPLYPADRIAHILSDSGVRVGLTTAEYVGVLADSVDWIVLDSVDQAIASWSSAPVTDADRLRPLLPAHPAWLIYTSGSTGLPKGVIVPHAGAVNFAAAQVDRLSLSETARTLHFASPSFDASMLEFLMAFASGATMVIVPPTVYGGTELADVIKRESVSHAFVTPAAVASMDPDGLDCVRVLAVGGEHFPAELARVWLAPHRAVFNLYGPTEATIATNFSEPLSLDGRVAIGGPITGMSASVLGPRLHPVPAGVLGELYLAGVQVARGYRGKPGLTASRFVAGPGGTRRYRTGDLVRYSEAHSIEYVRRGDFQVQLRGFRIELGEVESALLRCSGVANAVAVVRDTEGSHPRLVGYVAATPGETLESAAVVEAAKSFLTAYMVPDAVVVLDRLPLTPAGKLDRAALPEPLVAPREFRHPESATERLVAEAFEGVLGVDRVGLDDDFFEFGGNSLVGTKLVSVLGEVLGTEVPVRWLFTDSTVSALAARIDADRRGAADRDDALACVLPIRSSGGQRPLFCIHPMSGIAWCYSGLAAHIDIDVPLYGIQTPAATDPGFSPETLDDIARRYADEIARIQPSGPYRLLGWSLGGVIAYAVASEFARRGESTESLFLLDSLPEVDVRRFEREFRSELHNTGLGVPDDVALVDVASVRSEELAQSFDETQTGLGIERLGQMLRLAVEAPKMINEYVPGILDADVTLFVAADEHTDPTAPAETWQPFVRETIVSHTVPEKHGTMTSPTAFEVIGPIVDRAVSNTQ